LKIKGYCPECGNTKVKVLENIIHDYILKCPNCGDWKIEAI